MDPVKSFESLPRNKKVLVFAGALGVAALLYLYSKKKKESEGESESESEYSPTGVGGATTAEGEPIGTDEGMMSALETDQMADPYLGGGFGGAAPAEASMGANTTNNDGTVPSVPIGTINTGGGPVFASGANQVPTGEAAEDVTGGGAPVTPHPAAAHLPAKKAAKPAHHKTKAKGKAHKPARKTAKHSVTHTKKKKVVAHHTGTHHNTPTHHTTAHHTTRRRRG